MRSNTCERRRWEGVRFSRSLCKRKGMESGLPPAPPSALQLVRVHTKRLVVFHPLQTLASPHGRRRNESHKRRQVSWTLFGSLITATFTNYKITSPLLQQVLIISGRKMQQFKNDRSFFNFTFPRGIIVWAVDMDWCGGEKCIHIRSFLKEVWHRSVSKSNFSHLRLLIEITLCPPSSLSWCHSVILYLLNGLLKHSRLKEKIRE